MLATLAVTLLIAPAALKPVPAKIQPQDDGFVLLRDGKPYTVKGVGLGNGPIPLLVEYGANSVRTWGVEQLEEILPLAEKHGFTVCAGIWIQHTEAMDYNDATLVERQKQEALAAIRKYKDHPSLLFWAVGNEAHGFGDKYNPKVYQAINDIVREGKKIDPNHPFITVNADLSRIEDLNKFATDVDAIGFNTYGGAFSIADRYREAGGKKPILLTEFGPLGMWELPKTAWGAAPEPNSTQKAGWYRQAYEYMQKNRNVVLGSYAFLWGNKQEVTHTWFGMVTNDGAPLPQAQVAREFWTGQKPADLCPVVDNLTVDKAEAAPGATITATLTAHDPEGKGLTVTWEFREEQQQYLTGGKDETVPADVSKAILRSDPKSCVLRLPAKKTGYRLFATIKDPAGNAATANVVMLAK